MNNDFEKVSEKKERVVAPEQDFARSFERGGVPEFKGDASGEVRADKYGIAKAENNYYGETMKDENLPDQNDDGGGDFREVYDEGITGAAALINYGLNAAAREVGVETVVQKLKDFDTSGREDPVGDFFDYLGIDTPEERKEMDEEGEAAVASEVAFREGVNDPGQGHSAEGALQAINEMKNLIGRVEGADAAFEDIREKASVEGEGYFKTAVKDHDVQGLTELFGELAQRQGGNVVKEDGGGKIEEVLVGEGELEDKGDGEADNGVVGDEKNVDNEAADSEVAENKNDENDKVEDSVFKMESKDKQAGEKIERERERLNPEILKKNI